MSGTTGIGYSGTKAIVVGMGVRPALWVDLSV